MKIRGILEFLRTMTIVTMQRSQSVLRGQKSPGPGEGQLKREHLARHLPQPASYLSADRVTTRRTRLGHSLLKTIIKAITTIKSR